MSFAERHPAAYASLWMLAAGLGFALMGVCVKLGASHFSVAEMVFWRSLVTMALAAGLLWNRGASIRTTRLGAHVHRGVSGFCSLFMLFYALTVLPVATAMTLNYTSPLFVALLFGALARQPIRPLLWAAVTLGFFGTILLLRPTISPSQVLPALIGLASGAISAIAYWNVHRLVQENEPEERVVFYFGLFCALGALVWMLPQDWSPITSGNVVALAGVGLFGALAQSAMTRAYGRGSAIVAAALSYSTIVFSSVLEMLVFGVSLPLIAWTGIALIIGAGIMAVRLQPARRNIDPAPQITND